MKRLSILILIFFGLSGCTSTVTTGNKIFLQHYQGIQKGITTKAEVLQMLGKPREIMRPKPPEEVLIYERRKNSAKYGFMAFSSHCYLDTERLSIYVNEKGVVRDYTLDSLSEEIGCCGGGSTYVAPTSTNPSSAATATNYYRPNYSSPSSFGSRTGSSRY